MHMSTNAVYYTGDSIPFRVQLKVGTAVEVVLPGSVVTACLATNDSEATMLAGPWLVSSETVGSDWLNGVVIAWVDGDDTLDLDPQTAVLEIQMQKDDTVRTWRAKPLISIKRGTLPND
jgi:hypothetical protein